MTRPPDIFVFGSNLQGIHRRGAARYAVQHYGAEAGVGEGPTGLAYAIPTKTTPWHHNTASNVELASKRFIQYARDHADTRFLLTKVGCGSAGFRESWIASLFLDASDNVTLIRDDGKTLCLANEWLGTVPVPEEMPRVFG